ncbi:PREDICTED: lysosome membrane protein 2-like [Amphimedon queenslandica]|uniref:Uncharacterized protein n=1 Tax=Amphimedon queenslandica TaxID=400682 RepID=A0A1X7UAJ6_AMPQE|nr:PREDICTED: lysosome membrane protein 2-like [Amphimedon queenslandica]|eukprot:XP_011405711.2 PREDICTED: lysosome membrane protein 2-like [Amphimedon queenslandica]
MAEVRTEPVASHDEGGSITADHQVNGRPQRQKKRRCSKSCCCWTGVVLLVLGTLLVAGLGVVYYYKNQIFFYIFNKELSLTKSSPMTPIWLKQPPEIYNIYYFNITNPDEIQYEGAAPNVEEIGPFTYLKEVTNEDEYWNKDETLLSYKRTILYTDDLSVMDPYSTTVTTINVPLLGLLKLLEDIEDNPKYKEWKQVLDDIFRSGDWINELLDIEPLFVSKTVDEILWGYEDPLFKLVHELDPTLLPMANFSLETREKVYEYNVIYTGKNDSAIRSNFYIWNGMTDISEWGTATARMINGTDAVVFHSNVSRNDTLTAFTDDFERSAYFSYESDEYIYDLLSYRFILPTEALNTSNIDPGYYPNGPNGLYNVSAIEPFNAPFFISKPHFLDGDPQLVTNITGLHPNKSVHDSYLNVEPITGTTVKAAKKLQVNVEMKQREEFIQLRYLKELTYYPLFYIVNVGAINKTQANVLHDIIKYSRGSFTVGVPVLMGTTGFVVLLLFVCVFVCIIKIRKTKTIKRRRGGAVNETTTLLTQ